jgi:hypothetical protein
MLNKIFNLEKKYHIKAHPSYIEVVDDAKETPLLTLFGSFAHHLYYIFYQIIYIKKIEK